MWSRRSCKGAFGVFVLLSCLQLASCASGSAHRAVQPVTKAGETAGGVVQTEVPPAALTMFQRATAAMAAGDYLEAELRFEEFVLQYPGYPGAWVNLAIIHTHEGDDSAVEAALERALAINPDHAAALNQLGQLQRRRGNFEEAAAAYLKAVTASPGYALAHYNLGVLNELYLQRPEVALGHFIAYQELAGADAKVEKWIADLRRRLARTERAANAAD